MRRITLIAGLFAGSLNLAWGQVEVRRCVLDGQSRMIAVMLHNGRSIASTDKATDRSLWASYSPETGTLIRCWSGSLSGDDFPRSEGPGHLSIPGGKPVWTIRSGDEARPITPKFLGYVVSGGAVTFRYEVKVGPTQKILIEESPSASQDSKVSILRRSIHLSGVPSDISLSLDVPVPTATNAVETNGSLIDAKAKYPESPQMAVRTLLLRPNATTFLNVSMKPGGVTPSPKAASDTDKAKAPEHPSYALATLSAPSFSTGIGDVDVFPTGDIAVCTHRGDVFRVSGWDKGGEVKVKKVASGLDDPRGLKVFGNYIYVLQREELTELIDSDKDGIYDDYRAVNQGWPSDGATAGRSLGLMSAGQVFNGVVRSKFLAEIHTDGTAATKELSGDMLAIGTAPKGQRLFCLKNQLVFASGEPLIDLPEATHIGDIFPMPGTTGPYIGQILISTDTHGFGRVFLDKVGTEIQGAFIPVIKNFTGRFKVNAKGVIVGGDKSLHKLTPTGKGAFAVQSVRLREGGVEVWLNDSIEAGQGMDSSFYRADTPNGALSVGPIQMNKWRNRIFLPLGGLKAGQLIHVTLPKFTSMKKQSLWTTEFWYTARALSTAKPFGDLSATAADDGVQPHTVRSEPEPTLHPEPR